MTSSYSNKLNKFDLINSIFLISIILFCSFCSVEAKIKQKKGQENKNGLSNDYYFLFELNDEDLVELDKFSYLFNFENTEKITGKGSDAHAREYYGVNDSDSESDEEIYIYSDDEYEYYISSKDLYSEEESDGVIVSSEADSEEEQEKESTPTYYSAYVGNEIDIDSLRESYEEDYSEYLTENSDYIDDLTYIENYDLIKQAKSEENELKSNGNKYNYLLAKTMLHNAFRNAPLYYSQEVAI